MRWNVSSGCPAAHNVRNLSNFQKQRSEKEAFAVTNLFHLYFPLISNIASGTLPHLPGRSIEAGKLFRTRDADRGRFLKAEEGFSSLSGRVGVSGGGRGQLLGVTTGVSVAVKGLQGEKNDIDGLKG